MSPARSHSTPPGPRPQDILQRVRRVDIRTRRRVTEVFAGGYHSVFKGRGMEFHEVREYVPGDEVRAIDWNVTARSGRPFVKQFVEERELKVMLLVDCSASMTFGSNGPTKRDLLAELAGVLALSALRNHDKAGLILFSDRVESYLAPAKGPTQGLRMIRDILYVRPQGRGTRLAPALDFLNHVIRRGAVVFLLSDFLLHEDESKALTVSARRHDLVLARISDTREHTWPAAGLVEWEDAESGRRHLLDSSDPITRRRLRDMRAARDEPLRRWLRGRGIDRIDIETGSPYPKALMRFFEQRRQRRHH